MSSGGLCQIFAYTPLSCTGTLVGWHGGSTAVVVLYVGAVGTAVLQYNGAVHGDL